MFINFTNSQNSGNGTQSIFYDDPSVFYISLHGSPDYPFYTGSEEEKGEGAGLGYNINVPLHPQTTTDEIYLDNLNRVLNLDSVVKFDAEIVIVSLGLDTWCEDPVGGMKLLKDMETYKKMGSMMKKSPSCQNRPFLFVQEGGYTVEKLGDLAGRVLQGYLAQE
jgi:acetoin utilization deacetylase AcuC-like enzyme